MFALSIFCHSSRFQRVISPILFLLFLASTSSIASAQTLDPGTVEFDPSADHNSILSNGKPVVDRYDLAFYYLGASQPFQTASLGKPSPESDGKIRVNFLGSLTPWPLPGIRSANPISSTLLKSGFSTQRPISGGFWRSACTVVTVLMSSRSQRTEAIENSVSMKFSVVPSPSA